MSDADVPTTAPIEPPLPSEMPTASPTTSPPSCAPSAPTPATKTTTSNTARLLLLHLRALPETTDSLLTRLTSLLSSPAGIDASLATTSYALLLLHVLVQRHGARLSFPLRVFSLRRRRGASSTQSAGSAAGLPGAAKLAEAIGDFRLFTRLWNLLAIWAWFKGVRRSSGSPSSSSSSTTKEQVLKAIPYLQIASCALFQLLENAAYLAQKGVVSPLPFLFGKSPDAPNRIGRTYVWSARFWAAHVGLELLRLGLESPYSFSSPSHSSSAVKEGENGEKNQTLLPDQVKEAEEKEEAKKTKWRNSLLSSAAYAPLTVHYGTAGGLLGDGSVGLLGLVAGGVGLRDVWRNTAAGSGSESRS